jgi:hypothetical protein
MFKILASVSVALFISVSAFAAPNPSVYGTWQFPVMSYNGFDFSLSMTFESGKVSAKNICSYNGQTSEANVAVPASYTESTITTLGQASDTESKNGVSCDIQLTQAVMEYSLSTDGNSITLNMPSQGAGSVTITRK